MKPGGALQGCPNATRDEATAALVGTGASRCVLSSHEGKAVEGNLERGAKLNCKRQYPHTGLRSASV